VSVCEYEQILNWTKVFHIDSERAPADGVDCYLVRMGKVKLQV